MSHYLEIRQLSQQFSFNNEEIKVFQDVSFSLEQGSFLCILGSSGCGKTTLLRCLAGFQRPTSGEILIQGTRVENPGKHCAMVFQTFDQLLPWKTVMGNVTYPLSVNNTEKKSKEQLRETALEYLGMVGLTKYLSYYPHQLSGGMKQRVAIARALAAKPSLILMDEPFASLDADTRTALQKELLQIWKLSGTTVLFVTHSIMEAIALSTKMLVMGTGGQSIKLFQDNPVEAPYATLKTPQSPNYSECWTALSNMIRRSNPKEDE